jgi:hypothetical protein
VQRIWQYAPRKSRNPSEEVLPVSLVGPAAKRLTSSGSASLRPFAVGQASGLPSRSGFCLARATLGLSAYRDYNS